MRWNNPDMCLTVGKQSYKHGDDIPEAALTPERLAFFMLKCWILEHKEPGQKGDPPQQKRGKGSRHR